MSYIYPRNGEIRGSFPSGLLSRREVETDQAAGGSQNVACQKLGPNQTDRNAIRRGSLCGREHVLCLCGEKGSSCGKGQRQTRQVVVSLEDRSTNQMPRRRAWRGELANRSVNEETAYSGHDTVVLAWSEPCSTRDGLAVKFV